MTEEKKLRALLADIHRQHQAACAPIVKRLAEIESIKVPNLILNTKTNEVMTYDQWAVLQDDEVLK